MAIYRSPAPRIRVSIPQTSLQRDIENKALLETDRKPTDEYIAKKRMIRMAKNSQEQINSLEERLAKIETLLEKLVERT